MITTEDMKHMLHEHAAPRFDPQTFDDLDKAFDALVANAAMVTTFRAQLEDAWKTIAALEPDAQRYRGIRLLTLEKDEPMQQRMLDAMDKYGETVKGIENLTPEILDQLIDGALVAIAGARNADNKT